MKKNLHQNLIDKSLKGDERAQFRLFDLYIKAMYNTVLRMVPEENEAEDIVQEGFIKAFSKLDQFRNDASFGAWLKRIMVNTAFDSLKKQSPEFTGLEVIENIADTEKEEEFGGGMPNPAEIHRQIKKLPKGCRVVFTLYQVEGYEQKEIAEILGISLSTVKTQYRRARLLLKKRLIALKDER